MAVDDSTGGLSAPAQESRQRHRNSLLTDLGYMAGSAWIGRGAAIVYLVLIRRLLPPEAIGVVNIVSTLATWLAAVTVGVGYSSERLMPLYRGRGQSGLESRVRSFLFNWMVAEGLVVALAIGGYAILFGHLHSPELQLGLYWLPVLFFAQKLLSVYLTVFRSSKQFRAYSISGIAFSSLDWAVLPFVIFFDLKGLFAAMAVVAVLKLVYCHSVLWQSKISTFSHNLDGAGFKLHLPYGPQYSLFKLVFTLTQRMDAMLVGLLVGTQSLAFYYLGNQIAAVAIEVPLALVYISYPNLMERFASTQDNRAFFQQMDRYLRVQLYAVLPLVMPAAYFGSEFIVLNFLPEYQPGLWAVKLAIVALGFAAVRHFYYQLLFAYQKVNILTALAVGQLGTLFVAYLVLQTVIENPIVAVAAAALVAQAAHFALVLLATQRLLKSHWPDLHRSWAGDFVACGLLGAVPLVLDLLVPLSLTGTLVTDFAIGVLLAAMSIAAIGPLSYRGLGEYRTTLVQIALGRWRAMKVLWG
jgi:O-antigen/teichoic acid export membrane protein